MSYPIAIFRVKDVLRLLEHSEQAPLQRVLMEDLINPEVWKAGLASAPAGDLAGDKDIDLSKLPKRLIFVKDEGAYLMSGGLPALAGKGHPNHVLYAVGYGPDDDHDRLRDDFGGDDFADGIETADVRVILAKSPKATRFVISVEPDCFSLSAL